MGKGAMGKGAQQHALVDANGATRTKANKCTPAKGGAPAASEKEAAVALPCDVPCQDMMPIHFGDLEAWLRILADGLWLHAHLLLFCQCRVLAAWHCVPIFIQAPPLYRTQSGW